MLADVRGKQFLQYLVDVATKYGVLPHVRFGEAAESCAWCSARPFMCNLPAAMK